MSNYTGGRVELENRITTLQVHFAQVVGTTKTLLVTKGKSINYWLLMDTRIGLMPQYAWFSYQINGAHIFTLVRPSKDPRAISVQDIIWRFLLDLRRVTICAPAI
jgi:hypothetical protein